jgi:hypothetical protein
VGGVLDTISAIAPGATVTISAWCQADTASLMVTASGPSAVARIDPLSARVHRVAGDAWRDFGADQLSVEWTWPHSGADPALVTSTR